MVAVLPLAVVCRAAVVVEKEKRERHRKVKRVSTRVHRVSLSQTSITRSPVVTRAHHA
jgi:hypothetical protein